jgi:hypothetical protein
MSELSTEEQRKAQRDAWRKAIAKASAAARTGRTRRKPAPVKVGMHRKAR